MYDGFFGPFERPDPHQWLYDYQKVLDRENYRWEIEKSAGELQAHIARREKDPSAFAPAEKKLGNRGPELNLSHRELRRFADHVASNAYGEAIGAAIDGKTSESEIYKCLSQFAANHGVSAPNVEHGEYSPAIARLFCSDWWTRAFRREVGRKIETQQIAATRVHKRKDIYVSEINLERRREQRKKNAESLQNTALENQFGDEFSLLELVEKSNANPKIRRAELMVRIAGDELIAREYGYSAEFVTVTAPSRFHSVLSRSCEPNPKYDGSTPKDAQAHLQKCWARCRSALSRRAIPIFGIRIAEPHHDGCPHWHFLLFMPRELSNGRSTVSRFRALIRRYFWKQCDALEPGAKQNRCKFVSIDWKRGSAAAYVAKYVAKNIDGFGVETDRHGTPGQATAARVDAWASTWGIRQFQHIGGAPVGVWRELRRIQTNEGLSLIAEQCREAADTKGADAAEGWANYTLAQGGPFVSRDQLEVRLAKTPAGTRWDAIGQCPRTVETKYGDDKSSSTYGVQFKLGSEWCSVVTRIYDWKVVPSGKSTIASGDAEATASPVTSPPWSSVNNCTRSIEPDCPNRLPLASRHIKMDQSLLPMAPPNSLG